MYFTKKDRHYQLMLYKWMDIPFKNSPLTRHKANKFCKQVAIFSRSVDLISFFVGKHSKIIL